MGAPAGGLLRQWCSASRNGRATPTGRLSRSLKLHPFGRTPNQNQTVQQVDLLGREDPSNADEKERPGHGFLKQCCSNTCSTPLLWTPLICTGGNIKLPTRCQSSRATPSLAAITILQSSSLLPLPPLKLLHSSWQHCSAHERAECSMYMLMLQSVNMFFTSWKEMQSVSHPLLLENILAVASCSNVKSW